MPGKNISAFPAFPAVSAYSVSPVSSVSSAPVGPGRSARGALWALCALSAGALLAAGCAKKPAPTPAVVRAEPVPPVVKAVPPPAPEPDPRARIQALVDEAFKPLYFPYDRAELGEASKAILARAGDLLKREPSITVVIHGNTDERGTEAYNMALGQRRAAAARDYLVNYGVQASRLRLISFGEEKPASPGHAEQDWALNRRDEFDVTF